MQGSRIVHNTTAMYLLTFKELQTPLKVYAICCTAHQGIEFNFNRVQTHRLLALWSSCYHPPNPFTRRIAEDVHHRCPFAPAQSLSVNVSRDQMPFHCLNHHLLEGLPPIRLDNLRVAQNQKPGKSGNSSRPLRRMRVRVMVQAQSTTRWWGYAREENETFYHMDAIRRNSW